MAESSNAAGGGEIGLILERYEGRLTRYAARITGDADAARDVVQDVFLRLCREKSVQSNGRLAPWLYTVCRRRALDARRKLRRSKPLADAGVSDATPIDSDPAVVMERRDGASSVMHALSELPENQQEVIRLRFQEGLSYKEIAEVTGRSVNHVGVLIHNAIKAIRKTLQPPASGDA